MNNIFVLSGPSGVGKTTLARALVNSVDNLALSVSCTTRPIRPREREGIDYFFITHEEFMRRIRENEFIEFSRVYGHLYGTLKASMKKNQDIVLILDPEGASQINSLFLNALLIFILPPSREVLENRLTEREGCSWGPRNEMKMDCNLYHYLIINELMEKSCHILENIIISCRYSMQNQCHRYPALVAEWKE